MRRTIPATAVARRGKSGRRAIATVEFALVAPLLMLILAGVLDFAMLLRTSTCAAYAARAGAEYGSGSVTASLDLAGMQSNALKAAPNVTGMTATAVRSCQCTDGTSVSCSGSCVNGKMLVYVQVTTSAAAHTIFNYSGLNFSNQVTAQVSMRAQ